MNNALIHWPFGTIVFIYNRYGHIAMRLNPWGNYWNIWLFSDESGIVYRGICFHRDMWYCIHALVMIEGRK